MVSYITEDRFLNIFPSRTKFPPVLTSIPHVTDFELSEHTITLPGMWPCLPVSLWKCGPEDKQFSECRRTSAATCGQACSCPRLWIQVIPLPLYANQVYHDPHSSCWGAHCRQPRCCFGMGLLFNQHRPETARDQLRQKRAWSAHGFVPL